MKSEKNLGGKTWKNACEDIWESTAAKAVVPQGLSSYAREENFVPSWTLLCPTPPNFLGFYVDVFLQFFVLMIINSVSVHIAETTAKVPVP